MAPICSFDSARKAAAADALRRAASAGSPQRAQRVGDVVLERALRGCARAVVTARYGAPYNGFAHAFAGMGVQFILFSGIDLGVGVLLDKPRPSRFRPATRSNSRSSSSRGPSVVRPVGLEPTTRGLKGRRSTG
jgi:hypothetical protein